MKVTILGSGTSGGVPQLGCQCSTCTSNDPRDRRLRTSALIEEDDTAVLIDCGPDFREQLLALPYFPNISAVLITHEHFDHVGGIDDIRPGILFGDIRIYAEDIVAEHLMQRIPYCFTPLERRYPGVPAITLQHAEPHETIEIGSLAITPIRVMHGQLPILGFTVESKRSGTGKLTYITDMKTLPDEEWQYIEHTDILICNALHSPRHNTHQSDREAIAFAQRVAARQTYFIHMSHLTLPHAEAEAALPPTLHYAYDGLTIEV